MCRQGRGGGEAIGAGAVDAIQEDGCVGDCRVSIERYSSHYRECPALYRWQAELLQYFFVLQMGVRPRPAGAWLASEGALEHTDVSLQRQKSPPIRQKY